MPPLADPFEAECLLGAGPVEYNGHGCVGVSPLRLESWLRLTGYYLSPFAAQSVLEASYHYAIEAQSKSQFAPWKNEADVKRLSQSIKQALRRDV